jgi:hypothetical protein
VDVEYDTNGREEGDCCEEGEGKGTGFICPKRRDNKMMALFAASPTRLSRGPFFPN